MKNIRYLIILLLLFSIPTFAETQPTSKPPEIQARLWNLQDADILSVINEVSLETGKNFVVDPRVNGKISLVSSKPIKPEEVYDIFLSILELLGYSAIPSDNNVVKIIPNTESGESATKVASAMNPGRSGEVVVRVIPLENVSANQLIPIIRPMLPQWSNVAAYSPGNVIILLGRAANIQRIIKVIRNIDKSSENDIDIIPLHQASAPQMATVLTNLQTASRASGDTPQVSIGADERSNSILLSGNKNARLHMKYLIQKLDIPMAGIQGNTQVIYLRYLKAKELAPILGKIVQHMLGKAIVSNSTPNSSAIQTTFTAGLVSKNAKNTPANETSIQAEPNTNALIITAPPAMMRSIKSVVAKLDVRPAQVLVESILVEISQNDIKNLGIQWGDGNTSSSSSSSNSATATSTTIDFPPAGAGNIGVIPSGSVKAVLNILENKSGVDILSTPTITVLDNQPAILEIGQSVPYQTGNYITPTGSASLTPFQTTTPKPVTLRVEVTPQINLGTAVRLKIKIKNDSLQNPQNPGLNPIINTSSIENSVIVNTGDILVLGGLISNSVIDSTNKVPILGDIPILGKLFQQKAQRLEKKNLMVFIKPTILHNNADSMIMTSSKYETVRQTQIRWPEKLTPGGLKQDNILLPWKNKIKLPSPFADNKK